MQSFRVRLLAVAALLAGLTLAGCAAPEEPNPNPLFGLCPQWQEGPGQAAARVVLDAGHREAGQVLAPDDLHLQGRAFDMLRLDIQEANLRDATVRLRASAEANGTTLNVNLWDYRPAQPVPALPVVAFTAGTNGTGIIQALLTSVTQDQAPRPAPVRLSWTLEGNGTAEIAFTATFHYKVCGASFSSATA